MDYNFLLKLPRWDDLPEIDLYSEQVLQLLNIIVRDVFNDDNSYEQNKFTSTMINNYVKLQFIAPPINRKYNRLSIASLIVIIFLKSVFSMKEISDLIKLSIDRNNPINSYNTFCEKMEISIFALNLELTETQKNILNNNQYDPRMLIKNVCSSFASQLYVRQIGLYN